MPEASPGGGAGRTRRLFAAAFSLAVVGATVWFFAGRWPEIAARLARVPPAVLPLLLATALVNFYLTGQRNRIQWAASGVRLAFPEWMGLTFSNSMFNYLPARGGAAFIAVYLKRRHGFPYLRFLLLAAVLGPVYLGASTAFAALLLVARGLAGGEWHGTLIALLLAGAALAPAGLGAALLVGRVRLPARLARVQAWVRHVAEGAAALRERPGALASLGGLYVCSIAVFALRSWIIFRSFGHEVSYPALCVVQSIVELSTLVSVTPGNLGLKEALSVFSAGLLGIDAGAMMAAALLDRAVNMTVIFTLGPLSAWRIVRARGPEPPPGAAAGAA